MVSMSLKGHGGGGGEGVIPKASKDSWIPTPTPLPQKIHAYLLVLVYQVKKK